jgi:hypothetical protein
VGVVQVLSQLRLTVFDIVRDCRYGVSGFPTIKFFPKTNKDGESVSASLGYC